MQGKLLKAENWQVESLNIEPFVKPKKQLWSNKEKLKPGTTRVIKIAKQPSLKPTGI